MRAERGLKHLKFRVWTHCEHRFPSGPTPTTVRALHPEVSSCTHKDTKTHGLYPALEIPLGGVGHMRGVLGAGGVCVRAVMCA
jgi:hypothetical protein